MLVCGALAAAAVAPGHTLRVAATRYSVEIQAVFNRAGDPLLVANFSPDGSLATPHWSICRPDAGGRCTAAAKNQVLRPGPEPAGTRFLATARYAGRTYSAAVTWNGRVQALTLPSLGGIPREGGVVDPLPGQWNGGWGGEFDQLGVEACATASGTRCRMLGGGELGCPDNSSPTPLRGWFTGWYLFALDARLPRDGACAGTGYIANADLPLWRIGPTVTRSAALGQITGPPRPSVKILRRGVVAHGTLYVARLRCPTRCTVLLEVQGTLYGALRHFAFRGVRRLGVRAAAVSRGPVTVSLHVDDSPGLQGRSSFR